MDEKEVDQARRKFMMASLISPVVLTAACQSVAPGKPGEAVMQAPVTPGGGVDLPPCNTIKLHNLPFSPQEAALFEEIERIPVIDAHEHLFPEPHRLKMDPIDVFTLFSHYTRGDLSRAGMSVAAYEKLFDGAVPLEKRWRLFQPFYEKIRMTGYCRSARLALKRFYGFDDFTEQTYRPISEAMQAFNKPGIYRKVLRDACNIRTCLTQSLIDELADDELLKGVAWSVAGMEDWNSLNHHPFQPDKKVETLQQFLDCLLESMKGAYEGLGAVGFKFFAAPLDPPDKAAAEKAYEDLKAGKIKHPTTPNPIRSYIHDELFAYAGELGVPVAVHTGYWGDFRALDPLHMITPITRHPNVRFDMYHLGYPWVRESLMLAKGFDNVWLNFAWLYIISQKAASDALDEAIDLLPSNKVIGFGGDYQKPVEKVYGHMVMARECMSRVLCRRIERGEMTETQALDMARQWLWDNPRELYKLDV